MTPFNYPDRPLTRRHGPQGYLQVESYRPWLRDEFTFRCVYCLKRERWSHVAAEYEIDHFRPITSHAELATDYDNLLYACTRCNNAKREQEIPDPLRHFTTTELLVHRDGRLEARTPEAQAVISKLDLDSPQARQWRLIWMRNIELAREFDPELHQRLLGFPDDLPELSNLRPPAGNTRPEGLGESHSARREKNELPATF